MTETIFDKKIKPMFTYVGSIGAVFAAIAYIIIVVIMVFGVAVSQTPFQTFIFAIINATIGLIIMQFLKIQGMDLAKRLEQNVPVLTEWNATRAKDKKLHGLRWFWFTTLTKDVIIKCITLASTTFGIIYIVVSASQDYTLLLLALFNLIMFACFGLLSLVNAYDFFNDEYIPFLKEKINEKKEAKRLLDLAKEQYIYKTNVDTGLDSGDNFLESCMDNSSISSNSESVVLDANNSNNSILVRTSNSCDSSSATLDCGVQKDI